MNEIRSDRIEAVEIEALEQRKLLQHHRTLAPRAGLAHRVTAIVIGQRRFDMRRPARHVVGGEHAAMPAAAGIHDLLGAAEAVDRFRDETLRPRLARPLDLRDAIAAGALGFLEDAAIGGGERGVGEQRAGCRHLIVRADRPRPMSANARETRRRPSRWWRWRAPAADDRSAHNRSPAPAPRASGMVP